MTNDKQKDRLVELLNCVKCNASSCSATENGRCGDLDQLDRCQIEAIADHILADGWMRPPCKVGDTVYKIIKFCGINTGYKEFYRPSKEFEENCQYLDPQSWYDDCDRCKAVEDYDEGCYCDLNVKIFCDTCKSRLAIQKEKFTYGMMTRVFNTPMFDKNTSDENILYLTKEEAEAKLKEGVQG